MAFENIVLNVKHPVATVTVNRPTKMNALNQDTLDEISVAMTTLRDDSAVRTVIITGAGEKAFVAGADIAQITALDSQAGERFARHGQKIFEAIETFPKPVIAAVNGFALGGGCELAMACHLRLAGENARFGLPEINLGILPGYGGTQRLTRLVGLTRALQMMLTGDMIDAAMADRIGLVNAVHPAGELHDESLKLAHKLAEKAPFSVQYILQAAYQGLSRPMTEGLKLEANLFGQICQTEDMKEGTRAFIEKRKPGFRGK